jgi:hypothetical protein
MSPTTYQRRRQYADQLHERMCDSAKTGHSEAVLLCFLVKKNKRTKNEQPFFTVNTKAKQSTSMPIVTAQVIKPTPESKLGIGFAGDTGTGSIVVTKISDTGLFASTQLRVGQEILSVNDIPVKGGVTVLSVLAILQSSPKNVVIQARYNSFWKLTYEEKKIRTPDGGFSVKTKYAVNSDRSTVPPGLVEMGVTPKKWARIFDAYSSEWLPAIYAANRLDTFFQKEMGNFVGAQMVRGFAGFGTESAHERKVFNMCNQHAVLNNNCNLVASNVLAKANALLNAPHGVMAQLMFQEKELSKIPSQQPGKSLHPIGLEFLPIED